MKCDFCGKKHNHYHILDPKNWRPDQRKSLPFKKRTRLVSGICRECERLINHEVLGKVNTAINKTLTS